jgi:hypothetical protein
MHAVILSGAKCLAHAAWITLDDLCDPQAFEKSLTLLGITRVFIFYNSKGLLRHPDLSTNAAAFDGPLVH